MKPEIFVILTPGFPADETDTACLPSQSLFVKMLKKEYPELKIAVLALQYPFSTTPYPWHGCRVIPFGGKERGKLFRLLIWRKAWLTLKKIHKENRLIGILSFWCGECAFLGNRFGRRSGVTHHCWIMGQDAKQGNSYVNRIKPAAEELITLSDFLADEFYRNYGIRPATVIPNGIDTTVFVNGPAEKDIDLAGSGSLIPLKQFDVFIECVRLIREALPTVKAVICGKGPEQENLRALAGKYGLENHIHFTGELPHTEMLQVMQRSRILLHTSGYEGFGAVCIEALYAGCRVISFVKPMDRPIENWHTVTTVDEMAKKATALLQNAAPVHKKVLPFPMADSLRHMMQLYNYNEAASS